MPQISHKINSSDPCLKKFVLKGHLIPCGDFNASVSRALGCYSTSMRERGELGRLFLEKNLDDIWQYHHADEKDYTFYSSRHLSYSGIDYF